MTGTRRKRDTTLRAVSAAELGRILVRHGFAVRVTAEPDDLEDGLVEITPTVHVQVGLDGLCGTVEEPKDKNGDTVFVMHDPTPFLSVLVAQLRAVLANPSKADA